MVRIQKEKIDGVLVDLRNNGGGSLTEQSSPDRPVYRQWPC
ncbi:MAG: hypothetical protein IPJ38_05145 [Dechloromonas sp.]|uniref:Uncharacterized protein n=1 Tax=Candidatus Dechloromonas phosphorivorans TaxID=2899244 RepID=A0A935JXX8_9RHOO|nr:hypothetical protein [Candidatus Dechloromonas phosphorivorans]